MEPAIGEARTATRWTLAIDCAQPAKPAAFWALALGYAEGPRLRLDVQVGGREAPWEGR